MRRALVTRRLEQLPVGTREYGEARAIMKTAS